MVELGIENFQSSFTFALFFESLFLPLYAISWVTVKKETLIHGFFLRNL